MLVSFKDFVQLSYSVEKREFMSGSGEKRPVFQEGGHERERWRRKRVGWREKGANGRRPCTLQ